MHRVTCAISLLALAAVFGCSKADSTPNKPKASPIVATAFLAKLTPEQARLADDLMHRDDYCRQLADAVAGSGLSDQAKKMVLADPPQFMRATVTTENQLAIDVKELPSGGETELATKAARAFRAMVAQHNQQARQAQLSALEAKRQEARRQLDDINKKAPPEVYQQEIQLGKLAELSSRQTTQVQDAHAAMEQARKELQAIQAAGPVEGADATALIQSDAIMKQLLEKQSDLGQDVQATSQPSQQAKADLAKVDVQIADRRKELVNQSYAKRLKDAQSKATRTAAIDADAQEALAQTAAQIKNLDQASQELARLRHEREPVENEVKQITQQITDLQATPQDPLPELAGVVDRRKTR